MTLSPKLGVVGISTLWHFRLPLPIQMFIKVASSPRLSGIGMPSPILWSHPLIVLLSSLLWWELGTNSLITGPGEWLSFRRFTSKLSWSWSWDPADVTTLLLTIRGLIKHFTVIYGDANKQFLTLTLNIFCHEKNLPIWDPNLPTKNCRSHYLSPRKDHMYAALSDLGTTRHIANSAHDKLCP